MTGRWGTRAPVVPTGLRTTHRIADAHTAQTQVVHHVAGWDKLRTQSAAAAVDYSVWPTNVLIAYRVLIVHKNSVGGEIWCSFLSTHLSSQNLNIYYISLQNCPSEFVSQWILRMFSLFSSQNQTKDVIAHKRRSRWKLRQKLNLKIKFPQKSDIYKIVSRKGRRDILVRDRATPTKTVTDVFRTCMHIKCYVTCSFRKRCFVKLNGRIGLSVAIGVQNTGN